MGPVAPITCEKEFHLWLWNRLEFERQLLAAEISAREPAGLSELDGCKPLARYEGD